MPISPSQMKSARPSAHRNDVTPRSMLGGRRCTEATLKRRDGGRGNLPVPSDPFVPQTPSSASRTGRYALDHKKSPSRFRFRPPLPLTFRFRLATAPYCLRTRFRPTCAPCSAQSPRYEMQEGRSRRLQTPWPQFAVFPFFNISTAFFSVVDRSVERPLHV